MAEAALNNEADVTTEESSSTEVSETSVLGSDATASTESDETLLGSETDGESSDESGEQSDKASIEYEAFTVPDGMEVNEQRLEGFTEFAREHQLDQESAQKVVDMGVELMQELQQAQLDAWNETTSEWTSEINKMSKEAHADAVLGLRKLGEIEGSNQVSSEELEGFKQWLNDTSIGNHPVLVKVLANAGQLFREDRGGGTTGEVQGERTHAERLYPDHPS
jgi:hypothetical protein